MLVNIVLKQICICVTVYVYITCLKILKFLHIFYDKGLYVYNVNFIDFFTIL